VKPPAAADQQLEVGVVRRDADRRAETLAVQPRLVPAGCASCSQADPPREAVGQLRLEVGAGGECGQGGTVGAHEMERRHVGAVGFTVRDAHLDLGPAGRGGGRARRPFGGGQQGRDRQAPGPGLRLETTSASCRPTAGRSRVRAPTSSCRDQDGDTSP